MYLEIVIQQVLLPSSSRVGEALGGCDQARLEVYNKAVSLKLVVQKGGAAEAETLFIG